MKMQIVIQKICSGPWGSAFLTSIQVRPMLPPGQGWPFAFGKASWCLKVPGGTFILLMQVGPQKMETPKVLDEIGSGEGEAGAARGGLQPGAQGLGRKAGSMRPDRWGLWQMEGVMEMLGVLRDNGVPGMWEPASERQVERG